MTATSPSLTMIEPLNSRLQCRWNCIKRLRTKRLIGRLHADSNFAFPVDTRSQLQQQAKVDKSDLSNCAGKRRSYPAWARYKGPVGIGYWSPTWKLAVCPSETTTVALKRLWLKELV